VLLELNEFSKLEGEIREREHVQPKQALFFLWRFREELERTWQDDELFDFQEHRNKGADRILNEGFAVGLASWHFMTTYETYDPKKGGYLLPYCQVKKAGQKWFISVKNLYESGDKKSRVESADNITNLVKETISTIEDMKKNRWYSENVPELIRCCSDVSEGFHTDDENFYTAALYRALNFDSDGVLKKRLIETDSDYIKTAFEYKAPRLKSNGKFGCTKIDLFIKGKKHLTIVEAKRQWGSMPEGKLSDEIEQRITYAEYLRESGYRPRILLVLYQEEEESAEEKWKDMIDDHPEWRDFVVKEPCFWSEIREDVQKLVRQWLRFKPSFSFSGDNSKIRAFSDLLSSKLREDYFKFLSKDCQRYSS